MRHVRILGACLVAVFAIVAIAATTASAAEPEWGHCVSVKKGFYGNSNCTGAKVEKKGKPKGTFEWVPGAGPNCYAQKKGYYGNSSCTGPKVEKKGKPKGTFEKTGGGKFQANAGAGVLHASIYECRNKSDERRQVPRGSAECHEYENNISEIAVECESEHASGEASGTAEVTNVSVRFKGCELFGVPANTPGLPAGEIQVEPLQGKLGYINKAATPEPEVGVLLQPKTAGGQFAEFELEEVPLTTRVGEGNATEGSFYESTGPGVPTGNDGVISPITPVNKMTHTFTQDYTVKWSDGVIPTTVGPPGNKVENVPSHFEGGSTELLETFLENTEEHFKEDWSPAGQELTNTNTLEEGEAEIKA